MTTLSNDPGNAVTTGDEGKPLIALPMSRIVFYISIVWLLYLIDFMARFGINPLYPLIQKDLGLTDPQVGLLGSVVILGMAILVMPLSYLADRWSRGKLVSLMALVWSACSIVSGFAKSLPIMLIARCGLGVGEASFAPTATSLITSWFKKSQWGRVLGFFNTAASMGIFLGSLFSGYMAVTYGWRAALIALGMPGILLGIMALLLPDTKPRQHDSPSGIQDVTVSVKSVVSIIGKNKSMLLLVLVYGVVNMSIISIIIWLPMYFVRIMGMTVPRAASLSGITATFGIVAYPLGGYLSDLLAKKDVRYRVWFPGIISLTIAFVFTGAFYLQNIALLFIGIFLYSFIHPSVVAGSQELVPPWYRSVSMGCVVFGMQLIGMTGPFLTGVFSEHFGLRYALIVMQICYIICFAGFFYIGKTYVNDYTRARKEEASIA
jgi:MFS transporter, Spinster family, sphingosine-1-phosphate transporter